MTEGSSRRGVKVADIYVVLCAAAIGYAWWKMVFVPGTSELSALPVVVLGLPWTAVLPVLMLAVSSSSAWIVLIAVPASCALNAWLLYRRGSSRRTAKP